MKLRDVELSDLDAYVRMRCDPVMMAGLGGPLPREGIEAKVRQDVETVAADRGWIKMIVLDEDDAEFGEGARDVVAGNVVLWSHDEDGEAEPISETGWMVLPEFQGRGLAKRAERELLRLAHKDGRWGLVHAYPGAANGPSNGICRSLGFRFVETRDVTFADRIVHANHWIIDPADLR
jgi:RimJ/RimL family protein N-acetyltransferase